MDLRIAAYGVIVESDRMLLAHWNEHGHDGWTLPGGGLEPGEDPADAAVREIFEETGYRSELDELLAVNSHVFDRGRPGGRVVPLQAIRILYRAHVTGGELTDELDGSTDQAAWFPLGEVKRLKRVGLVDVALRHLA